MFRFFFLFFSLSIFFLSFLLLRTRFPFHSKREEVPILKLRKTCKSKNVLNHSSDICTFKASLIIHFLFRAYIYFSIVCEKKTFTYLSNAKYNIYKYHIWLHFVFQCIYFFSCFLPFFLEFRSYPCDIQGGSFKTII